jgi:fructose-1,6-bisphosphatase/inositol monophosphatase family enzyme
MTVDMEAVARVITEAAQTLVLPRFTTLSTAEVQAKPTQDDPEDIVTVVDQEVETYLARALTALVPQAAVIGEEAVRRQPDDLERLCSTQPLWVIDPIDGTKNFAAGKSGFGIMVALVVDGHTIAAWLALPAREQMYMAEAGAGAFLNGERIRVPRTSVLELLRGEALVRYMPEGLGTTVMNAMQGRSRPAAASGCAAVEYTDILSGRRDFVVYYRLLPWDHVAPALILTEADGCVTHVRGGRYTARSQNQLTVVARDADVAQTVCEWLVSAYARWTSAHQPDAHPRVRVPDSAPRS